VPKKRGRPFGSYSNKTKKMLAEKRAKVLAAADKRLIDLQINNGSRKRQRRIDSIMLVKNSSLSQKSS